ncbi:type II toxin-antitoxin system RatA family toxin [Micromonospora sp. NPDC049102]|uniref:type II toxin-antitoxin system RatA family toxin n=1 Tax=Micromonospora sp. NPDC049102 TaxID=3364265 RepID=UPI0037209C82
MRRVEIQAFLPGGDGSTVFDQLVDFERYPQLVDVVQAVTVQTPAGERRVVSSWEVLFRNGILAWTEADELDRDRLSIEFDQIDGDFDEFSGAWTLRQDPDGVAMTFVASFDFGVPSLASIIDPVAERVLTETIHHVLRGLFPAVVIPDGVLATAAAGVIGKD